MAEPWRDSALCQFDPEIFFPERDRDTEGEAVAVCRRCPVVKECLNWTLELDARSTSIVQINGVSGGLTQKMRRSIFRAAFGLGKSMMQIEIIRLCMKHVGAESRGLIVAPLGVRQEFKRDAKILGVHIKFVRRTEEVDGPGMYLTNFESVREGNLVWAR